MRQDKELKKIILFSSLFHLILVGGVFALQFFKPRVPEKVEPIWIELVQLEAKTPMKAPPPPIAAEKPVEKAVEPEPPKVVETPPEIKPEPKPEKPKEKPPQKETKPNPPQVQKPISSSVESSSTTESDWDMPDFEEVKAKQAVEKVAANYKSRVVAAMSRYWQPGLDLDASRGATVLYEIVILRDGSLGQVEKLKSSGNAALDQMAHNALQLCKLPPLPPQLGEEWRIKYGFKYDPK